MSEPEEDVVFWLKRIVEEFERLNANTESLNDKLRDYFLSLDPDK